MTTIESSKFELPSPPEIPAFKDAKPLSDEETEKAVPALYEIRFMLDSLKQRVQKYEEEEKDTSHIELESAGESIEWIRHALSYVKPNVYADGEPIPRQVGRVLLRERPGTYLPYGVVSKSTGRAETVAEYADKMLGYENDYRNPPQGIKDLNEVIRKICKMPDYYAYRDYLHVVLEAVDYGTNDLSFPDEMGGLYRIAGGAHGYKLSVSYTSNIATDEEFTDVYGVNPIQLGSDRYDKGTIVELFGVGAIHKNPLLHDEFKQNIDFIRELVHTKRTLNKDDFNQIEQAELSQKFTETTNLARDTLYRIFEKMGSPGPEIEHELEETFQKRISEAREFKKKNKK